MPAISFSWGLVYSILAFFSRQLSWKKVKRAKATDFFNSKLYQWSRNFTFLILELTNALFALLLLDANYVIKHIAMNVKILFILTQLLTNV